MIQLKNVKKAFGANVVTNDLNLTVDPGEFLAIIGRSGEGKSVLLKQIVGLIKPDAGTIIIDNQEITQSLTTEKRQAIFKKCGYVFQFAALLDSLTVFENIGITMLEEGISKEKILPLVIEKLQNVGLNTDALDKYPDELSGGMKKRVGLARTLMLNPKILLYDEPTTGLDPITSRIIHELIKKTHLEHNTTSVVISHDVEIFKFASHVAMLHEGTIIYKGRADTIWDTDNPYVYQFIRGLEKGPIKPVNIITQS
jgi:phospholipid/cholesterol/gamma-HCH transport system ATP-binding protein